MNTETQELQVVTNQHGEATPFESMPIPLTDEQRKKRERNLKQISELDPSKGVEIMGVQYWNARQGDELQGKFIGWTLFNQKDDEGILTQKVTALIDTPNGTFGCNTIQFIEKFKTVPIDTPVYIQCTFSKDKAMKEYKIIDLSDQLKSVE